MLKVRISNDAIKIFKNNIRFCQTFNVPNNKNQKKKKIKPKNVSNKVVDKNSRAAVKTKGVPYSSKYKHTIFLPSTTFPNFIKDRATHELELQKDGIWERHYDMQRYDTRRDKEFVLHDGPPYANGDLHIGHALNKILKDITGRHKMLDGYRLHYRPGWDCHGLPIELKALQRAQDRDALNSKSTAAEQSQHSKTSSETQSSVAVCSTDSTFKNIDPLTIRQIAREFSEECVSSQMKQFQRWGVLGDWQKAYLTSQPSYVSRQLRLFDRLRAKGLVYQAHLPVYFSPSSGSTLAESELEYNDDHISPTITVAFRVTATEHPIKNELARAGCNNLYLPVFTTTPWSLPFNRAVCYNPALAYCLVAVTADPNITGPSDTASNYALLWAKELLHKLDEAGLQWRDCGPVTDLTGLSYHHPTSGSSCPLLPSDHVTASLGTGLVHTAPAHGPEDHDVGVKHGLQLDSAVDDEGRYGAEAGTTLAGLSVLEQGNDAVMAILGDREPSGSLRLLQQSTIRHSYPYDWRTKQPVMMRSTKQWFIDTKALREPAEKCLSSIGSSPIPEQAQKNLLHHLQRPHWCISRQRVWGAPLPVFYDADTDEPVEHDGIVDHLCSVIKRDGTDAWWKLTEVDLLPPALVKQYKMEGRPLPRKGTDILDIWLDSGSSWLTLGDRTADLLVEGHDQYRGWFQSTLLTSVAEMTIPVYKHLLVHGFTVDQTGRKMSKSKGNVVNPSTVTDGTQDRKALGADVLRWWVSRAGTSDARPACSDSFLDSLNDEVHAIRKVIKFLLGSLKGGYYPSPPKRRRFTYLDSYTLHRLHLYDTQAWKHYSNYEYHNVALNTTTFIRKDLSQFYLPYIKHRLYCGGKESDRDVVKYVLHSILTRLITTLTPILPHLTQEANNYLTDITIHENVQYDVLPPQMELRAPAPYWWYYPLSSITMKPLLAVKEQFNTLVPAANTSKLDVIIYAGDKVSFVDNDYSNLRRLQHDEWSDSSLVCEVLQAASVTIKQKDENCTDRFIVTYKESTASVCVRCRKCRAPPTDQELCAECVDVVTLYNDKHPYGY